MHLLPPFRRRPETSQIFPDDHFGGWGHSVGRGMSLQVPTSSMGVNLVRRLFGSKDNAKQPLPDAAVASECLLGTSCADRRLSFLKRCKRVDRTQSSVVSEQAVRGLVSSWAWSMIWSTISGEIVIVVAVVVFVGERGGSGNRRKNKRGKVDLYFRKLLQKKAASSSGSLLLLHSTGPRTSGASSPQRLLE